MSSFLYRLGHGAAAHPWRTLTAWLLATAAVIGLSVSLGGAPQDDWDIPDARAQHGIELLRDHVPGAGNAQARVVVHNPAGAPPAAVALDTLHDRLAVMPHVVSVSAPVASADRDTALISVSYDVPVTDPDLMGRLGPLDDAVGPARAAGLQVELGGDLPDSAAAPMKGYGELIGIVAALFILVLTFGSVVSAGLPVAVALAGLAVGTAGVTILAAATDVSTVAPVVASMVGLGVGIDYALLLVTRHVEFLRAGHDVPHAAGLAAATAGRSVVFAASTVLVSLMGLRLTGLPTFASFGFATAIAVTAVLAAALTLVPVLCRFAGRRLLPRRERRQRAGTRTPLTARWATRVSRRPLPWALAAAALLLATAVPALGMRTWPQDPSSSSTDLTTRRAYDLVAAEYGAGTNGTLTVVAERDQLPDSAVAEIAGHLAARDDIVAVTPPMTSPDEAIAVLTAVPAFGPTDERMGALVDGIRADLPSGAELTGGTALFADIAEMLGDRLWLVIAFVVALSVLLLAMVFRSVIIPVKAAVMNLLSIAAAYGVMVAVFQWGWGTELLGLDHAMPVSSWIPILMFAILFGLSMDYEVFLLSRIREDWERTGDPHGSVVRGLSSTGRVISSAAAIMVAVFLGFATEADVVVKMLGVGMAVAIFLDATLVRMVLVPATMALLGQRNWWLPAWLDRLLPAVRTEVSAADVAADHRHPAPAPAVGTPASPAAYGPDVTAGTGTDAPDRATVAAR